MKIRISVFYVSLLISSIAMAGTSRHIAFALQTRIPQASMKVTCPDLSFDPFTDKHSLELNDDEGQYGTASEFFGKNYRSGTYQCQVSLSDFTADHSFKTINVGSVWIILDKGSDSAEFTNAILAPIAVQDGLMGYSDDGRMVPVTAIPQTSQSLVQYTFHRIQ